MSTAVWLRVAGKLAREAVFNHVLSSIVPGFCMCRVPLPMRQGGGLVCLDCCGTVPGYGVVWRESEEVRDGE